MLIQGASITCNTSTFDCDFRNLSSKDDILTLLIHLGYVAIEENLGNGIYSLRIPNEELKSVLQHIVQRVSNKNGIKDNEQSPVRVNGSEQSSV